MNNWRICWFSRIFLLGILIFKGFTARRLYKSFGVKGLNFYARPHKQIAYVCLIRSESAKLLVVWAENWTLG
jgi:hypothetical protein